MSEMQLPVLEVIPDLKEKLSKHNTLILQAPPGAGKSTVLPLQLLGENWLAGQKTLMLEPRRIAVRSVAHRMAQLMGESVGETVGYRVRFEQRIGSKTRIEVLTEGILTRMLQQDNALEGVGLVIFDEFHERSLQADLALALSREVQGVLRPDLRLLIMSATLDGEQLSNLLGNCPMIRSEGRQYPVDIRYMPMERDHPLPAQVVGAMRKVWKEEEGDVLVFLPGTGEILRTAEILTGTIQGAEVYPLYGDLPQEQQQQALLPHPKGKRKIVLATSIAETSLTIEGIRVVIDSGLARLPRFDPRSGLTQLVTLRVTADTADQRAGRAGRLGPGICYRLWSEGEQIGLLQHRQPEILEADLTPTMLELANWGVQDIQSLAWLTPPPAGALAGAEQLLHTLGAVEKGRITPKGKALLQYPTHPRIAQLLLAGREGGLEALAADVAALLEERDPLGKEAGTDMSLRLEVLRKWRAKEYINADRHVLQRVERLAANWRRLLGAKPDNSLPADTETGGLLAAAYPERIARREQSGYRLANGRLAHLQEHDPLMHEEWLAIARLDQGRKGGAGKIFMAAPLDPADVLDFTRTQEVLRWDSAKGELIARTEVKLGEILVESQPLSHIPDEERLKILCEVVRSEGLEILTWSDEALQWQARVLNLRKWGAEDDWPDVSRQGLLECLEDWLAPFLLKVRTRDGFARLDLLPMLQVQLSWQQQQEMAQLAPEKLQVPSGSYIRLQYQADGSAPVLAVRLQEMFGQLDTPTVDKGRIPVLLHLLSPAYRPVQVTQDLRSFWQNTYSEVRKDLRGRYPKHYWPEDPFTAEAVRGVKRKPS